MACCLFGAKPLSIMIDVITTPNLIMVIGYILFVFTETFFFNNLVQFEQQTPGKSNTCIHIAIFMTAT